MAVIDIRPFGGMRPRVAEELLGQTEAVVARNVRLTNGKLVAHRGTNLLKPLSIWQPKTIWRYGSSDVETNWWLEFANDVDVIRSPVANDSWGRVYWTDGVSAKYASNTQILAGLSYPGAWYPLGLPAPALSSLDFTGSTPEVAADTESRAYLVTYGSVFEEEGPPSDASPVRGIDPAESCTVTGLGSAPPEGYANITTKNLYRSSSTGSSAAWQFVDEIPITQDTYIDSKSQGELGETLATEGWIAPPAGMTCLRMMAASFAVGIFDNMLCASEPNLPYAWPHRYPVEAKAVALATFRQSAVLLTDSYPYQVVGTDPSALSLEKLELQQACVSKRSVVETGDGCLYASPDGLVSIGSSGMAVVTSKLFEREQWQAYNPNSMIGFFHEGRYFAVYSGGLNGRGILQIDLSGDGAALTELDLADDVSAAHVDPRTDAAYLAIGAEIRRFNAGSPMAYTWKSKPFRPGADMTVARLKADEYPVSIRLLKGDTEVLSRSVTSADAFRLPAAPRNGGAWQVELTGIHTATRLTLASSMAEMKEAA